MYRALCVLLLFTVSGCDSLVEVKPDVTECKGDPPTHLTYDGFREGDPPPFPCTVKEAEDLQRESLLHALKPKSDWLTCVINEAEITCEYAPAPANPNRPASDPHPGFYQCSTQHKLLAGIPDFDPYETFGQRADDCSTEPSE